MLVSDPPIVVDLPVSADVETVWAALTDPDQKREWFFETMPDFKPEVAFETTFDVDSA